MLQFLAGFTLGVYVSQNYTFLPDIKEQFVKFSKILAENEKSKT